MKIFFDSTELNQDGIIELSQSGSLFDGSFKLGSTVCREVRISVLARYISAQPSTMIIKDDDDTVRFTLQLDSSDLTNIDFYAYVFVDKMVNLNQTYDFSSLSSSTVQNVLNALCTDLLNCTTPTVTYGGDILLNYSEDFTARDIVSWIAELNASFARITADGNLEFVKFEDVQSASVSVATCSDFKLGDRHVINRVYVELGTASYGYPETTSNDTVYLNPDNQLISDSGSYTIENIVKHIQSEINGFEFYSLKTMRCQVDQNSMAGDIIRFYRGGSVYYTIAQIDWNFNGQWYGGYSCEIETKKQQETNQINNVSQKLRSVKIYVDRQNGIISQEVNSLSDSLDKQSSTFQQTAEALEFRVSQNEGDISENNERIASLETSVSITADGVTITQGTEGAYVVFTDKGMDIYVEGVKTAWAEADGFSSSELMIGDANGTEKWHLHEANNGNTLMLLRR